MNRSKSKFLRRAATLGALAVTAVATLGGTPADASLTVHYRFANPNYLANENVGLYPLRIKRSDASQPGVICWGVTNASAEAGHTFDKQGGHPVQFAAGQAEKTVYVRVYDQGIRGPSWLARAFMYSCGGNTAVETRNVIITLLQNDPLDPKNSANPLGYRPAPTNGDPLQNVQWYVFGENSSPGQAAAAYANTRPDWAAAFKLLAYTPGSWSYRFWMWNQPAKTLARRVEKYLADAEVRQPNTTMQISTYSLIHGHCLNPKSIRGRYRRWVRQLARGIGNFRVVLYLEEDSLIATHCLTRKQIRVRMRGELAYAVKVLSKDPHALVYLDAGAPDASTPARTARMLRMADVAQAQGFAVNATHHMWTTTDLRYGQRIAKLTGGKHFIVNTGGNGRGPLLSRHPSTQGIENLCNPPGRGLGPLTWNTGYKYADAFLWFNNPGKSVGPCGHGEPKTAVFFPEYAFGLVQRWVNQVTGPHFPLIKSQTDM